MKIHLDPLDKLCSEVVRRRAVLNTGGCEYCGKFMPWKELQCSHYHGRRRHSTRYDIDNCAGLCWPCHSLLGENLHLHTEWFKKRLGSEKFEALNNRANQIVKLSIADKEKIKRELQEKLNLLKENE